MRRIVALAFSLTACAAVALALSAAGEGGTRYRVDAIFGNASFLIPGQDVRIAGTTVGAVTEVTVTSDNKARIAMEVDPEFGPFRSDADCFIAPQSLIGERFIQCAPGTPRGEPLRAGGDHPPTVPLANTHSPVDPDLVVNTYRMPTRERLTLIVNELGTGLTGNAEALNAAIGRAAPALAQTRRFLRIVNADRRVLGRLIERSDEVVGELARRRGRVASFIAEAERVASIAGRRAPAVAAGIRGLPDTLFETRASLDALTTLADRSRPLLGGLRDAAQPLDDLIGEVGPFSRAARPALRRLARMARPGRVTLREGAPIVRDLRRFARLSVPTGDLLARLNESLRDNGVPEGLQTFVANTALALARFDRFSHILPAYAVAAGECQNYAQTTTPACDGHLVKGPATTTRAGQRLLSYLLDE
ncbi:MAG: MlaD family protein [Solirubrobacteraceae bacterium]